MRSITKTLNRDFIQKLKKYFGFRLITFPVISIFVFSCCMMGLDAGVLTFGSVTLIVLVMKIGALA